MSPIAGLYPILDLPHAFGLAPTAVLRAMAAGGATLIQLRAKQAKPQELAAQAAELAPLAAELGVMLIVNDALELAERSSVAGVHLGQSDLARLGPDPATRRRRREQLRARGQWLGISTHSEAQLDRARRELAPDYLALGPIFATRSKLKPDPVVGLAALGRACEASSTPIVAIGGIDVARAEAVAKCGAAAVAVIGSALAEHAAQIRERCVQLAEAFARGRACDLADAARD